MNNLKYSVVAVAMLFASSAMAQSGDSGAPAAEQSATPSAEQSAAPSAEQSSQSGQTSGTDTKAQVKDADVFGYDITMGAANLTPEQLTTAKSTCSQSVTAEPLRYSPAVKAFCTSIQ